jgi:hypothetical protein
VGGDDVDQFEPLIGAWQADGEIRSDPPMQVSTETHIERLGELIVIRTQGTPAEMPDSVSIVGGAPVGEPQPMHYFDSRGVKRLYLMTVEGPTWKIWRAPSEDWNGSAGPGFNQRFVGEIAADGDTIEARWERGLGDSGDRWEVDFPLHYVRRA